MPPNDPPLANDPPPPAPNEDDEPYWLNDVLAFLRHAAVAPFIVGRAGAIAAVNGFKRWRELRALSRAAKLEEMKRQQEAAAITPAPRDILPPETSSRYDVVPTPQLPVHVPRQDPAPGRWTEQVRAEPKVFARVLRRSSFAGGGCGMQGAGCLSIIVAFLTVFTLIGPIVFGILGIWLFAYGGSKAVWFECSECGSELRRKRIRVCPGCHARFR